MSYLLDEVSPLDVECPVHGCDLDDPCFFLSGAKWCGPREKLITGGWQAITLCASGYQALQYSSEGQLVKFLGVYKDLVSAVRAWPRASLGTGTDT